MLATFLISAPSDLTLQLPNPVSAPALQCAPKTVVRHDDETELIQRAIAGSQQAYAAIVKRYERMVFSLTLDMLGNSEDAHEATQDAFLKAFRHLASWRGESRFSTWLYRIARTTALDRLRRKRMETVSLDAPESPARRMLTFDTSGLDNVVSQERSALLQEAFRHLLAPDSAVLTLFYLHEQSLEEICEVMGWTMSNAKSRLCRARQRLREVLLENYAAEFAEWI